MNDERFILDIAKQQEAERRLLLLGGLINQGYEYEAISERSFATFIPIKVLKKWHFAYRKEGLEGLIPSEWVELPEKWQQLALNRYEQLGAIADSEVIPHTEVAEIAETMRSSIRTAERWLNRYRIGGLWGLTPGYNPLRSTKVQNDEPLRDLGSLDNDSLAAIYDRYKMLGDLVEQPHTTDEEVSTRAKEVDRSERTLWNYLRNYRKFGLPGLAPKQRSDKGNYHRISKRMVRIIEDIRLTNKDWPVRAVYDIAREKARQLGDEEPSIWQVRQICKQIPEAVKLIADGRKNEFRNSFAITYSIPFKKVVYQVDHTLTDVLVRDMRSRGRNKSGMVRLWLTTSIDSRSRLLVGAKFGYDRPNRHSVAMVIRASLLNSPGGIPDEIWVDNGKDLISKHVRQLTRELDIKLHICAPNQPQHRGIGERFFRTLNSRLWATIPGYVNSNTRDRNPTVEAIHTPEELIERFWTFIDRYHNETHSTTKKTPLDCWGENCFALPVEDVRRLDVLLLEPFRRKVIKTGIKFNGRQYWHAELAHVVGESILVRADTNYGPPDEIEVFHDDNWLCTAFAIDSERGNSVTREEIADAQKHQRNVINRQINEARFELDVIEQEIVSSEEKEASQQSSIDSRKAGQKRRGMQRRASRRGRSSKKSNWLGLEDLADLDNKSVE